jgi:hypothetical protein
MLDKGIVRIGTAAEYRIPDGKDGARSDTKELITEWIPGARSITVDKNHPFIREIGVQMEDGKKIDLVFEKDTNFLMQANAFMFCMSSAVTENMRIRMANDFGCDACVKISHAEQFASALGRHTLLRSRNGALNAVNYKLVMAVKDFQQIEFFTKPHTYGWQREVRAVWPGTDVPDAGAVIEVPEIIPLLRRLY